MSRIPDEYLNCVCFLYPSRKHADGGDRRGGTGFFISVGWADNVHRRHIYAATNKHNITSCRDQVVIRATQNDGSLGFIESRPIEWHHSSEHDISVLPISPDRAADLTSVSSDLCVAPEDFEGTLQDTNLTCLGPGDQVFMVGRFISHDGKTKNHPSVRFGNISMNAAPIQHPAGYGQESFAVEMRSISGYSGSPVFVFFEFNSPFLPGINRPFLKSALWLLGVDWGHIGIELPVLDASGYPTQDGSKVKSHTSMSGVVPAWRLTELLMTEPMVQQRVADEDAEREKPSTGLDRGAGDGNGA